MLFVDEILVSGPVRTALGGVVLAGALTGCGQSGPLYLPTDPAAQQRATLPQVLLPELPRGGRDDARAGNGTDTRTPAHTDTTVPAPGVGTPAGASAR